MDRREFLKSVALAGAGLAGRQLVGTVSDKQARSWKLSGPDVAEIVCIVDRSGSMGSIREDTIEAFNKFIKEQQGLPGKACLTLTLFNDAYDIVLSGADIQAVKGFSRETYFPMGSTALLDAVGQTVDSVKERIYKMVTSQRPEKVLFVILTDGEENASREYSLDQIRAKIVECEGVDGWKFLFLGANQDAWLVGGGMGVPQAGAATWATTSYGTRAVYASLNSVTTSFRETEDTTNWTPDWGPTTTTTYTVEED